MYRNLLRDRKNYFQWHVIILSHLQCLNHQMFPNFLKQPLYILKRLCRIKRLCSSSQSVSYMTFCSHQNYIEKSNFSAFWKGMLYVRNRRKRLQAEDSYRIHTSSGWFEG